MAAKKYYAWSELRNGGEIEEIQLPANKGTRNVVTSRNIVAHGAQVTQKELGCSDEEWEALIAGGSIRDYPVPEGVGAYVSPSMAFVRQVTNKEGEIDMDKIMALGLSNPPAINPPAEDEAEVPVGA